MPADQFSYPRWLEELWDIETRLRTLSDRLGDERFIAIPAPGQWSAANCIEHLVLSTQAFLPLWDAALREAKPGKGEAQYAWWEKQLLGMIEQPYRMKTKALRTAEPKSQPSRQEVIELFFAAHELVKERAERLRQLDISELRIVSPFASWMKYKLAFSFDLLLAHERRHLWQAEQGNLPKS